MTVANDHSTTSAEAFELIARHPRRTRPRPSARSGSTSSRAGARASGSGTSTAADINCRSSGGVFNFGHHPEFAVEALAPPCASTTWVTGRCRRRRAAGAAALARLLPEPLRYTFFTASGAEAVEVACKLARSVTRRTEFVCAEHGYHGHVGLLARDGRSAPLGPLSPADARHRACPSAMRALSSGSATTRRR